MCMRQIPCPLSAAPVSHPSSFSKTQAAVKSSFQKTPAPVPLVLPLALPLWGSHFFHLGSQIALSRQSDLLSLHPMAADGIPLTHSLIPNDGGGSSSTEPNSAPGYLRHSIKIFSSRVTRWACFPHLENTRGLLLRKSALSFCLLLPGNNQTFLAPLCFAVRAGQRHLSRRCAPCRSHQLQIPLGCQMSTGISSSSIFPQLGVIVRLVD